MILVGGRSRLVVVLLEGCRVVIDTLILVMAKSLQNEVDFIGPSLQLFLPQLKHHFLFIQLGFPVRGEED